MGLAKQWRHSMHEVNLYNVSIASLRLKCRHLVLADNRAGHCQHGHKRDTVEAQHCSCNLATCTRI